MVVNRPRSNVAIVDGIKGSGKCVREMAKYSEPKEEKGGRKTASETRKGLERLFMTFEKERFLPQK